MTKNFVAKKFFNYLAGQIKRVMKKYENKKTRFREAKAIGKKSVAQDFVRRNFEKNLLLIILTLLLIT